MRTFPSLSPLSRLVVFAGALAASCTTTPMWSIRVVNATGRELESVVMTIEESAEPNATGLASHSTTTLRLTGGGGSTSDLRPGSSFTFESPARGTPQITMQVVWAPGEAPQEFRLDGLSAKSNSLTARLTPERGVDIDAGH